MAALMCQYDDINAIILLLIFRGVFDRDNDTNNDNEYGNVKKFKKK